MKRIICLFLFVFSLAWVFAGFIAADEAGEIGSSFFTAMGGGEYDQYTIEGYYGKEGSSQPAFYIIRFEPIGCVLIAAEEQSKPILGYSLSSEFPATGLPQNLDFLLEGYANEIYEIRRHPEWPTNQVWVKIRDKDFEEYGSATTRNYLQFDSTWGQGEYYNEACPSDVDGEGGHATAGCTAVAMAQIMRYWQQPYMGNGYYQYNHTEYGLLSADFGSEIYDYPNMPDSLTASSTQQEIDAVSILIYHCGISVDTNYSPGESGQGLWEAIPLAYSNFFRFSPTSHIENRSDWVDNWDDMIRTEIDNGRPVWYRAANLIFGGHAFVVFGYVGSLFKINWGGDGLGNDFLFTLDNLNLYGIEFNIGHAAVFDLYPLPKPNAPSGLLANAPSPFSVQLSWTDNSDNEESFHIERKLGGVGAEWEGIASVGANVTSYLDGGLTSGYIYNYRVRSFNGNGFSEYSEELNTSTPFYECVIESSIEQYGPSTVYISWESQPNAYRYALYSADEPLPTNDPGWTLVTESAILGYYASATADRKFYHVKVKLIVSAPSNMIYVPGGTFNPTSSYTVTLSSFYIGKYEVTQSEYQAVMGTNPSYFGGNPNRPVEQVSWFKAIEFCNRRSMQEGFIPCYSYSSYGTNPDNWPAGWNTSYTNHTNVSCNWSANGYRLPTEMEWMFAAKGGNQSQGYTYSGSNNIDVVAWYRTNAYDVGSGHPDYGTHNVGTKASNELGTFDMSGNVWEWCWDIYGSYPSGSYTDPTGPAGGSTRVLRGGSWAGGADFCTVSYRAGTYATYTSTDVGFRCLRVSP